MTSHVRALELRQEAIEHELHDVNTQLKRLEALEGKKRRAEQMQARIAPTMCWCLLFLYVFSGSWNIPAYYHRGIGRAPRFHKSRDQVSAEVMVQDHRSCFDFVLTSPPSTMVFEALK